MLTQSLLAGLRLFVLTLPLFSFWFEDFDVPLLVVASLSASTNSDSVSFWDLGVDYLGLATVLLFVISLSVSVLDNSDSGCLCDMGRNEFLLSFFLRSTFSLSRSEDGRYISLVVIERELLKSVIISFILFFIFIFVNNLEFISRLYKMIIISSFQPKSVIYNCLKIKF